MSMIQLSDKSQHARPFSQNNMRKMVSETVTTNDLPDPD